MKFLIRDDDTSALTRPEELVACYEGVWNEIPINLSVTPFRIPGEYLGVPEALYGSTTPIPLEDNPELVRFLREAVREGRVHIALHGYHHERVAGGPEYVAGEHLAAKTLHGKRYLEELLDCSVGTFVPPNNAVGPEGFAAVVGAKLNIVNHPGFRGRARLSPWVRGFDALHTLRYRVQRLNQEASRFKVYHFHANKEASYITAGPEAALPDLHAALEACSRVGGNYILATHYHAFPRQMRSGETVAEAMTSLIARARSLPGVEFVSYDGLW
jgi:hypothetical protein